MEDIRNGSERKTCYLITLLILLAFIVTQYILRIDMFIYSDDVVAREYMSKMSILEYIRYYFMTVNGKVFTDPLGAIMGQWPFNIWKITDTLIYAAAACLTAYICTGIVNKNGGGNCADVQSCDYPLILLITCLTVMCLPLSYLVSAGFILTSTNYVYTTVCIIVCMAAIRFLDCSYHKPAVKMPVILITCICVLYASNQEQSACVLGGILTGYLILIYALKKRIDKSAFMFLIVDAAGLLMLMLSPGHMNRSGGTTGTFSIPDYADWTLANKLTEGITSTAANIYFQPIHVFIILCMLLLLGSFILKRDIKTKTAAVLLTGFNIYEMLTGYSGFVRFHSFSWGLPDTDASMMSYVLILAITGLIVFVIWHLFDSKAEAAALLWLLFIGAMSRIMMGFSSTLFGSSFRTFIYQIVLIGCVDIYIFARIYKVSNNKLIKILMIAGLFYISISSYLQNYIWLAEMAA